MDRTTTMRGSVPAVARRLGLGREAGLVVKKVRYVSIPFGAV